MSHFTLEEAQRVLNLEAKALQVLSKSIDESFLKACQIIIETKGRVVVSGMGKSGHIARKIAATLSSTGTPSLFVHPAEASHGDLGMISPMDTLIVLSSSGETTELSNLLAYAQRRLIPLIAITQRKESTLAETSTVTLLLPSIEEACPLGLAPTTSTTMMLALGDALGTTLLNFRGFSPEDFGVFHPGGKLGQRLVRVSQIMHRNEKVPVVSLGTPMNKAILTMTSHGFGCVGVIENSGTLVGIITDGDLRRHMNTNLLSALVEEVMTTYPYTIHAGALAEEALAFMNEKQVTALFVVESKQDIDHVVGIVHIHDFLRANIS
ncbi:D-arabinose 5-phosphate [Candidatus Paracaedimonas acanthamoebae]|nr:D-arabinose 5-phosphate [Candidatus Paracaedimonas acanthamoebae]